jgi:hypothetical protein
MTIDPKINIGFLRECSLSGVRAGPISDTVASDRDMVISTRSHHGADDVCGKPCGLER